MIVNELVTKITIDPRRAMRQFEMFTNSTVRKASSSAMKLKDSYGSAASRAASLWGSAMSKMRSATSKMANHSMKEAQRASNAYNKAFSNLKSPWAALGGGIAVGAIGKNILDAGIELEGMKAALVTAMGSQSAADKAFSRIEEFAKRTPYDLKQVGTAFVQLKNLGLDPSERALTAYGNTASAMNKPLSQMVEAVADATTGEFERLKEFGIKAKKDGDFVALTFRGVTKTLKNDAATIQDYLIGMGETQFAGGMERQAKTIGGMLSTLGDNFGAMGRAIWTSGVGEEAKKFTDWMTKQTDVIIEWSQKNLPALTKQLIRMGKDGFGFLVKHGPKILAVIGGIAAHFVGVKAILAGRWLFTAIQTVRSLTLAGAALNLVTFAIPIAIGVAIAAVGYLGYKIYQYFKDGESAVQGLRDMFPPLADLVVYLGDKFKEMRPSLIEAWKHIKNIALGALSVLGKVAKWVFENIIIPYMQDWVNRIITVGEWLSKAYDYWMPKLVTSFYYWRDSIADLKDNFKNFFNYLDEKFPWLIKLVEKITGMTTGMFGGEGGDTSGAVPGAPAQPNIGGPVNQNLLNRMGFDDATANRLVENSKKMLSGAKKCLRGVWMTQQATLNNTSKITADKAYKAADELARDPRFREIKGVTKEMMRDPTIAKMLHGATVIYNRAAGFSPTAGHAENWDMQNRRAHYGLRNGGDALAKRTDFQLQNARIFVPVNNNSGGGAPMNINQVLNIGPGANTGAVKQAAKQGTQAALNSSSQNNQRRTTRR